MKRDSNSGKIVRRSVGTGPVALSVLAALAVILLGVSRSRAEFVCGDHTGDDQITATDAQLVLRHAVNIFEPPLLCPTVSCTTTTVVVTTTSSTTTTLRYCCGSASIDPEATLAHLEAGVEHRIPLRVTGVPFSLLDLQCSAGDGGGQFGPECGTSQGIMIPAGGVLDTEFTYLLFDDAPPLVTITVETTPHSLESSCGSGCTVSDYRIFSVERTPLTTTTTTTTSTVTTIP